MAEQYKKSHDLLNTSIWDPSSYADDWDSIAKGMRTLVTPKGFDPKGSKTGGQIRAKVAKGSSEADVLRAGAKASRTATGVAANAGNRRALALKTVRHLYFFDSFGKQKIWILNLPSDLRAFPMEYGAEATALVDQVLNLTGEQFDKKACKDLSTACQTGLSWVQDAMIVAGSPLTSKHKKLFHRWFVPAGTKNEDALITTWASTLMPQLQKIASGLKTGEVILTDSPHERGTDSGLEKSEAFVFNQDDLIVVQIEKGFFTGNNTLTGAKNWARIMVHELTHIYAKTKDHSYSWQGLLPRDSDVLKSANDKLFAADPKFPVVRTLTLDQCKENADSWAFFIADCAGALSVSNRIAALGKQIQDIADVTANLLLANTLKVRAK